MPNRCCCKLFLSVTIDVNIDSQALEKFDPSTRTSALLDHPYHVHNFHEEPVHATSLPQTANTGTWVYVHVSKHLITLHDKYRCEYNISGMVCTQVRLCAWHSPPSMSVTCELIYFACKNLKNFIYC